jgi:signal transduction histidine kinase
MKQAMAAMNRFHIALLVLLPAILIVAATGGYWIAGRALVPVGRMTREVQAITVRNLDRRVEVPVSDADLQRLALTFNAMLKRLQTSVADLSRLTADASHELRTPVTLVRSTADVALTRPRSPEEYREALADILAHSERMSGLVDDLLVLARADAGVEPHHDESSDVVAAVHQALSDAQTQLDTANVTATHKGSGGPVVAAASAESLRRLFVILLSNAARYTPAGGRVTVTTATDIARRAVTIDVVDTGIGIDPADRDRVFDRFYRGTAARAIAADGSGLGLSIARAIVMTHGGTIEIAPPPPGGGCVVHVTLPVA